MQMTRRELSLRLAGLLGLGLVMRPVRLLAAMQQAARPLIIAVSGTTLEAEEIAAIAQVRPAGFMLYKGNITDRAQLKALTTALRDAAGNDVLIITDQEGGIVTRLKPPQWQMPLGAAQLGFIDKRNQKDGERATYINYRLIAHDLAECGINTNAAPVLDLQYHNSYDVGLRRSFAADPEQAARLGRIACLATLEGGVLPVLKHMPGQGRAEHNTDGILTHITASPEELERDWSAFAPLADMPLAMVSHAYFDALDSKTPGALSPSVIKLIREKIGFKGLLLSDDLLMKTMKDRDHVADTRAALAGCDLLHYSLSANGLGSVLEKSAWPAPNPKTQVRIGSALAQARAAFRSCDPQDLRRELAALIQPYGKA